MDLHNIREDYCKQSLTKEQCLANPLKQFEQWLQQAIDAKIPEPTAMNIATINADGTPSSRIVLLKEVNDQGFIFFTNYHSRKGQAIAYNPNVALNFFWQEIQRQVRIEGVAEKISPQQSDDYFATRPYTSRVGAWASEQSAVIANAKVLVAKAALIATKHPFNVPRPPHWGGYLVRPTRIEFWQGRPSRLHDRICYQLENNEWIKNRLSP